MLVYTSYKADLFRDRFNFERFKTWLLLSERKRRLLGYKQNRKQQQHNMKRFFYVNIGSITVKRSAKK